MKKITHLFFFVFAISTIISCASNGNSQLPLTIKKIASGKSTSDLLVMFPGINSSGDDFVQHGFVQMFQQRYPNVDITLVDTRLAYITDGNIAERIQNEIIIPALSAGYKNIWFTGISLGGLSVITYNKTFANHVNGIVLIAPYLGAQYKIEGLLSGGVAHTWSETHQKNNDKTIQLWRYLLREANNKERNVKIFLAYGNSDRFSEIHVFLAGLLDKNNVFIEQGGHNWTVWKKLWKTMLDKKIFDY